MKGRTVVTVMALLCALGVSSLASADSYILHVVDNSGSMSQIHTGTETRLDWVQDKMKQFVDPPEGTDMIHHGLYVIEGDDSAFDISVGTNGWLYLEDASTATWFEDYVGGLIENDMSVMTPLADSICEAANELQILPPGHQLSVYVYTDGNENWSDDFPCAQEAGDEDNVYDFSANAYDMDEDKDGFIDIIHDFRIIKI